MEEHDRLEIAVLVTMALVSLPYYVMRHPKKTYNFLFHGVGWYDD